MTMNNKEMTYNVGFNTVERTARKRGPSLGDALTFERSLSIYTLRQSPAAGKTGSRDVRDYNIGL